MAKELKSYKLLKKNMEGKKIQNYIVESSEGKKMSVKPVVFAFLVGRGQVEGVTAQIYQDELLFRGDGYKVSEQ